jgi:hypothetical protein
MTPTRLDQTLLQLFNYSARPNRPRTNGAGNFPKASVDQASSQLRKLSTILSQYKADLHDTELVVLLTEADLTNLIAKYRLMGQQSPHTIVRLICCNIVEDLRNIIARPDHLNLNHLL